MIKGLIKNVGLVFTIMNTVIFMIGFLDLTSGAWGVEGKEEGSAGNRNEANTTSLPRFGASPAKVFPVASGSSTSEPVGYIK